MDTAMLSAGVKVDYHFYRREEGVGSSIRRNPQCGNLGAGGS